MAARRKGKKSKKRARRSRGSSRWFLRFILLVLIGTIGWAVWLDVRIRTEFEGKRWALPARVYARPLELYPGLQMSPAALAAELRNLGYALVGQLVHSGQFSRSGDWFDIHTRGFTFWDGSEPPRRIAVAFEQGRVAALTAADRSALSLVRIEPPLIGKIYPLHKEDRVLVNIAEVPQDLIEMLVVIEDRDFYTHHGIDPFGIARALVANVRAGRVSQGGSTLTQQLVKNFFLTSERTLSRKINEAIMALLLEWHYAKNEILEAYLNEVYLGQARHRSIHGFGLAARFYFGKPLNELNRAQLALLVGLVKGPSYYNPRRRPERAIDRRNLVLKTAGELGVLTPAQVRQATRQDLGIARTLPKAVTAWPAYLDLVRRQLQRDYRESDLRTEGLEIFTALDPIIQSHLQSVLAKSLTRIEGRHGIEQGSLQAAALVVSIHQGEVVALAGGREAGVAGFNRALDALRPVGSLIKPAIYLTALDRPKQYSAVTMIDDKPVNWLLDDGSTWRPKNYDGRYHGRETLVTALSRSHNTAAVHLGRQLGLEAVRSSLRKLGVEREFRLYPSLLLGALSLAPVEVARMYHTLANGGFRMNLQTTRSVLGRDKTPLKRYELIIEQHTDPASIFILDAMLQEIMRSGTGRYAGQRLASSMPLAGKTGTTDELRDSWFAGYGNDYLAVIWVGRDDNAPAGLTGAAGAMQIWADLMQGIAPGPRQRVLPENVQWQWLDTLSGERSAQGCPNTVRLPLHIDSAMPRMGACAGAAGFGDEFDEQF